MVQSSHGMTYANLLSDAIAWLGNPGSAFAGGDISQRIWEHVQMSGLSVAIALLPALAAGMAIGHTRRAEFITVTIANLGRAIPSFAILAFFFPITLRLGFGLGSAPVIPALVFLAIPPILVNTYVGIRDVDRDLVEAARGMGMSGRELLREVEVPIATPLIVAGIRTAAVQVVATATLAALVAGGGLGRFIVDGFALREYHVVLGGAMLVAGLAIATELCFTAIEKLVTPGAIRRPTPFAPAYQEAAQVGRPGTL